MFDGTLKEYEAKVNKNIQFIVKLLQSMLKKTLNTERSIEGYE